MHKRSITGGRLRLGGIAALASLVMVGCSTAQDQPLDEVALIADPIEPVNRAFHTFNVGLDAVALRPLSRAYDAVLPTPAQQGVRNVSATWGLPSDVMNAALQGEGEAALVNFGRFAMNATFGLGGLLDPATEAGLAHYDTDFGETLAVAGLGEGIYTELPLLGPGTARDQTGFVVDVLTNPFALLDTPDGALRNGAQVLEIVDTRATFGDAIDQLLYESDDGYAASRLAYIQRRRAELARGARTEDDFIDIYAE